MGNDRSLVLEGACMLLCMLVGTLGRRLIGEFKELPLEPCLYGKVVFRHRRAKMGQSQGDLSSCSVGPMSPALDCI